MPETPSILSTKSLGAGARDLALSLGWSLREEDFIETRGLIQLGSKRTIEEVKNSQLLLIAISKINPQTLVIFTSENGVKYLPELAMADANRQNPFHSAHPYDWQVACLGGKTLEGVLTRFRKEQVVCMAKNAQEMAGEIIADGRFKEAVFFCALEHRHEMPAALREAGIRLTEVPVYKTVSRSKAIDSPYDGVLFFSPSGVASFFELNHLSKGVVCFAIGQTTAEAIKDYTDERIIASPTPSQADLLRCVQFYYDNHPVQP